MKDLRLTIINYILIAASFVPGFYMATGIYLLGNDPEAPMALWELIIASILLFGSLFGLLFLTITVLHWNVYAMVAVWTIITGFINIPFAWLFRKMFPSY